MQDYRNLKVWESSHQLTLALYKVSTQFPKEELYGLTSQVRRACASMPANVAEGCGRNSDAELAEVRRMLHACMQKLTANSYEQFLHS